jgi:hypothetical protein
MSTTEEVIYLEVDEDITNAIDKLRKSPATQVSIVVPKRSTLLQSLINLKLLKKSSDEAKKKLILVTNDRTSTHLAARLGIAVAATLKTKAAIPKTAMVAPSEQTEVVEAEADDLPEAIPVTTVEAPVSGKTVKLVGADLVAADSELDDQDSVLTSVPPITPVQPAARLSGIAAAGKGLKVPNFDTLQKRLIWGGLVAIIIVGVIIANFFLTSASVKLYAKGTAIPLAFGVTVDPTVKTGDAARNIIAGQALTLDKDLTATAPASGKKDIGTKAKGSITVKNCEDSSPRQLGGGSVFANGDKHFISDAPALVPYGTFANGGTKCTSPTVTINVTATDNGDAYNLGPADFTNGSLVGNFTIHGSQMSGGTTKNITVVAQADIDAAKAEALKGAKEGAAKDLAAKAGDGWEAIASTLTESVTSMTSDNQPDAEAPQVSVTLKAHYALLVYNKAELLSFIKRQAELKAGSGNQIYDDGSGEAQIAVGAAAASGTQDLKVTTTAFGGATIDTKKVANDLAGKRYGDAVEQAGRLPGVERVEVSLWPGFMSQMPRLSSHIKVDVKVTSPRG